MTWIKLDDKVPRHPKVASLSDRAFRWWVQSLCYASEFLTDGVLPKAFVSSVPPRVRSELLAGGLWADDGGLVYIHDYLGHQSSRQAVERERERNRTRRRGSTSGSTGGTACGTPGEVPRPEIRDQRSETEAEGSVPPVPPARPGHRAGALITSPLAFDRKHGGHVTGFCDWVCFPSDLCEQFASRAQWDTDRVTAWAREVRAAWVSSSRVASGSMYEFWNARWAETHPGATKAAKADWKDAVRAKWAAEGKA